MARVSVEDPLKPTDGLSGIQFARCYSERSASTGFTLAARAAGTADAVTAAARITKAETTKRSMSGQLHFADVFAEDAGEDEAD